MKTTTNSKPTQINNLYATFHAANEAWILSGEGDGLLWETREAARAAWIAGR